MLNSQAAIHSQPPELGPRLLNEHEAAEHLNLSVKTLRLWRRIGKGPDFLKLGDSVRYEPSTLAEWKDHCRVSMDSRRGGEA